MREYFCIYFGEEQWLTVVLYEGIKREHWRVRGEEQTCTHGRPDWPGANGSRVWDMYYRITVRGKTKPKRKIMMLPHHHLHTPSPTLKDSWGCMSWLY